MKSRPSFRYFLGHVVLQYSSAVPGEPAGICSGWRACHPRRRQLATAAAAGFLFFCRVRRIGDESVNARHFWVTHSIRRALR